MIFFSIIQYLRILGKEILTYIYRQAVNLLNYFFSSDDLKMYYLLKKLI